jgi:hypothetical protein
VEISSGDFKWRFQVEISSGNFKWKFQVEISSGNFKWKFQVEISSGDFATAIGRIRAGIRARGGISCRELQKE